MEIKKRKRREKSVAEKLSKQIQGLVLLGNTIPEIAKTLNMQRQLIEYYYKYRKLSTEKRKTLANKNK